MFQRNRWDRRSFASVRHGKEKKFERKNGRLSAASFFEGHKTLKSGRLIRFTVDVRKVGDVTESESKDRSKQKAKHSGSFLNRALSLIISSSLFSFFLFFRSGLLREKKKNPLIEVINQAGRVRVLLRPIILYVTSHLAKLRVRGVLWHTNTKSFPSPLVLALRAGCLSVARLRSSSFALLS